MGIALREETCAAIRKFVEEGGLIVADLAPAVLDGHGKPLKKGSLDDLFGVARDTFGYAQRTSDYLVGVTEDDPIAPRTGWWVGEWYEKGLKVTDGKALGKHWFQDVPALVVKRTGQGRALLLNFLHTCTVRRNGEPEDDDLRLMEAILREAAIAPQARIETDYGKPERHCEVNTLCDGAAEYVGVYAHKMPSVDPAKIVIRFEGEKETYDVRNGRCLGKVRETPLPLMSFEAALFARLGYQVTGVSVSARSARRGGAVAFTIEVAATAPPGRHVVKLDVLDPDRKRHPLYSRNVEVIGGKAEGVVHTALSDPRGTWRLVAREVVSGETDGASFRLR
jgi:hypothetical protein